MDTMFRSAPSSYHLSSTFFEMVLGDSHLTMHLNWTQSVGQEEVKMSFGWVLLATFLIVVASMLICSVCIVFCRLCLSEMLAGDRFHRFHQIAELLAVRSAYHAEANRRGNLILIGSSKMKVQTSSFRSMVAK